MRHRLAVSAASEIEGPLEAVAPSFSRSPQPRALGLLLGVIGLLLLLALAVLVVLGAQFARVNTALSIVRELRAGPESQSEALDLIAAPQSSLQARTEKLVSLSSFIEAYRAWDQALQSVRPLLGPKSSQTPPLFLEEQLITRLGLVDGSLARSSVDDPSLAPLRIAALLVTPLQIGSEMPSHLSTSMSEISSATHTLKALRNEVADVEAALSRIQGSIPGLLERVTLLHLQARRVLLLPESIPTPSGFIERAVDLEALLYQSGMLRGVPTIEGLPDGIENPEELVQRIAALGARGSSDTSRSPSEAQQELSNLTSAALQLLEAVQATASEERALNTARTALDQRAREQLMNLRKYWLNLLEESLSAFAAQMQPLALP